MNSVQILSKLKEGNQRFVQNNTSIRLKRPQDLSQGQRPFCAILSCADSRVPLEIIFDQDLGDLFVVRIAGNIATSEAVESIEFAAQVLKARACLVLGHTQCGAIQAAKELGNMPITEDTPFRNIMTKIKPAFQHNHDLKNVPLDELIEKNVNESLKILKNSAILQSIWKDGDFSFHKGIYDIATGLVHFLG